MADYLKKVQENAKKGKDRKTVLKIVSNFKKKKMKQTTLWNVL